MQAQGRTTEGGRPYRGGHAGPPLHSYCRTTGGGRPYKGLDDAGSGLGPCSMTQARQVNAFLSALLLFFKGCGVLPFFYFFVNHRPG